MAFVCGDGWSLSEVHTHMPFAIIGFRAQELCEFRSGRPGLPVPNIPYGPCGRKATLNCSLKKKKKKKNPTKNKNKTKNPLNCSISELRSCVKVEVAVLGSPSLIFLVVSVDVKQQ